MHCSRPHRSYDFVLEPKSAVSGWRFWGPACHYLSISESTSVPILSPMYLGFPRERFGTVRRRRHLSRLLRVGDFGVRSHNFCEVPTSAKGVPFQRRRGHVWKQRATLVPQGRSTRRRNNDFCFAKTDDLERGIRKF